MEKNLSKLIQKEDEILEHIDEIMKLYTNMIEWETHHKNSVLHNDLCSYILKRKKFLLERLESLHLEHQKLIIDKKSDIIKENETT